MIEIALTQGQVAVIDDCDLSLVDRFKWFACKDHSTNRFYAHSNPSNRKKLLMHRVILGVTDSSIQVDHIDGNGLNNSRSNLRACGHAENQWNSSRPVSRCGYIGVRTCRDKFQAKILHRGKTVFLGTFSDPISAAMAYDCAAVELRGEFARLNFENKSSDL